MEPTKQQVEDFYRHMTLAFDARLVQKKDDPFMGLVARLLSALSIQDQETFMRRYTTTIGHAIYIPFEIGVESEGYPLWWQIQILSHECEHVFQFDGEWNPSEGPWEELAFSASYVVDPMSRALWEAKAYRVNLELEYWRTGGLLDSVSLTSPLHQYGIPDEGVKLAERIVYDAGKTIVPAYPGAKQNVISKASQEAIRWLDQKAPGIRMAA